MKSTRSLNLSQNPKQEDKDGAETNEENKNGKIKIRRLEQMKRTRRKLEEDEKDKDEAKKDEEDKNEENRMERTRFTDCTCSRLGADWTRLD